MTTPQRRRPGASPSEPAPPAWPQSPDPPRPSHEEVAAVLRAIAQGGPWLADQEPVELRGTSGRQRVDAVGPGGVWIFQFWWDWPPGDLHPHLHALDEAVCPAGRVWVRGCGRWPSWDAGPEAVVLDPMWHLLEEEERWQLEERLTLEVVLMPMPALEIAPVDMALIDEWIEEATRP